MRHYSQAALQDGCHHGYVCTVPQQTTVLQALVLTKSLSLQRAKKKKFQFGGLQSYVSQKTRKKD